MLKTITVPITTTVGTYGQGQVIGGLITVSNALRSNWGVLRSAVIQSKVNDANTFFHYFIFSANPTSSTTTNGSTFVLHADDAAKFQGIAFAGWSEALGGGAIYGCGYDMGFEVASLTGSLYIVLLDLYGGITTASTSDLTMILTIEV